MAFPSDSSLEDLLEEYQEGSQSAFDRFFHITKDPLYSYVLHRVKNPENAQDIIQETYFRIHRYVGSFRKTEGKALPWLFAIVQNCINDHWKQQTEKSKIISKGFESAEFQVHDGSEERFFFKELILHFEQIIGPDDLDLLIKRIIEGSSFDEIALQKGIKPDNARQRLSRLLKRVKKLLQDD